MMSTDRWHERLDRLAGEDVPGLQLALKRGPLPPGRHRHLAPRTLPTGCAIGVVATEGEARLVLVEVAWTHSDQPPSATLQGNASRAIHRAIELAGWHYPHPRTLLPGDHIRFAVVDLDGVPPSIPIDGGSLGLAAFLATWSLLAQSPCPNGWVYTGQMELDHARGPLVGDVSHLDAKSAEVDRAGLRLRTVEGTESVDGILQEIWGPNWRAPERWPRPRGYHAETALKRLDLDYQRGALHQRPDYAALRFAHLADTVEHPNEQVLALSRAGMCWDRAQRSENALSALSRAIELAEEHHGVVESDVQVSCRLSSAVSAMKAYRFHDAEHLCRRALEDAQRWQLVKLGGHLRATLAQVLFVTDRAQEAIEQLNQTRHGSRMARDAYRIRALARAQDWDEADRLGRDAVARILERSRAEQQHQDLAYLQHARLDCLLRRGRRAPASIDWVALADDAERAVSLVRGRPRHALRRIGYAAGLRTGAIDHSVLERQILAELPGQHAEAGFRTALTLLEIAVLRPTDAHRLGNIVWDHIHNDGAKAWFHRFHTRIADDPEAALDWLEAERF